MTYEGIRRIDGLAGRVVCWLLTALRRLADTVLGERRPAPPQRILFLKLIEQGATVVACDALRLAAERVGRDHVYFCVFAENRFILDILDLVPARNIVVIRGERFLTFLVDSVRAVLRMRREHIDAVVDMEFFARASAILAFLSGARIRVGLHRFNAEAPYRGDLMTHRVQHNPYLHAAQAYRILVEALWRDPGETPLVKLRAPEPAPLPRFAPTDDETKAVRAKLEAAAGGPIRGPLILLNSSVGDLLPLRRWPSERYVALGRQLLADFPDARLGLTGRPSERDSVTALAASLGSRAFSLAGETTLRELLTLYTVADVLVTSDSGPGHFAALTPLDSVVLFGPETPVVFAPLGTRTRVLTAGLACSPCFTAHNHRFSVCTHNACMEAIPVETVLSEVRSALSSRLARRAVAGP